MNNLKKNNVNNYKIACITCVNNEKMYTQVLEYMKMLIVPAGFTVEYIAIRDASSMAEGYNRAMYQSDAKYKVYLHQDLFVINRKFFIDIIRLFQCNSAVGIIGVAGASDLPDNIIWWLSGKQYGKMHHIFIEEDRIDTKIFGEIKGQYALTWVVDGAIMATQYDVPWREDLFDGWHFYDISQCVEMKLRGYDTIVPNQVEAWCVHASGDHPLPQEFFFYRDVFKKHYIDKR